MRSGTAIRISVSVFGLLSLVLFCLEPSFGYEFHLDGVDGTGIGKQANFIRIRSRMKEDAKRALDKDEVKDIALYYRDLKGGAWFAINLDEKFNTASLMKVPLMMECFEEVEAHPDLLKMPLRYAGSEDWTTQQNIKPKNTIKPGRSYTLDDLIFRMIAYSDNNAVQVILEEFPTEHLCQFLSEHNLAFEKGQEGFKMSIGVYSKLFEGLYYRSILNADLSKKALSYLAAEDFPEGMHSAVPSNIEVDSKFGEKIVQDTKGKILSTQLHEIGIVRDGDHPFLLGIMTSGKDLSVLEKTIHNITHDIYEITESKRHRS